LALQERDFALGTSESNRFYALSPSEVCYLASSSGTRVLRADREPSSRRITCDENRL